jgi:hypothetical protein
MFGRGSRPLSSTRQRPVTGRSSTRAWRRTSSGSPPQRTLIGIDEVEHDRIWGTPPEHLDLQFEVTDVVELGGGLTRLDVHQIYRLKGSGDFAYERDLRIEIAVRDDKISRYEIRRVG